MENTNNKRKIATFCSYIPIEIIDAAGFTFSRIVGNGNMISPKTNAIFPTYMCSFASNCLDELCENIDEYAGAIIANSCHPMEGVYECLGKLQNSISVMMLDVPKNSNSDSLKYFYSELKRMISFFEENYSVEITDEKLSASINKYNKKRILRKELEKLIIDKKIRLTADEIVRLNNAFINNDDNYDNLINSIIQSKDRVRNGLHAPRIMLSGNAYTPMDIVDIVEEYGGNIVLSNNCNSYRNTPLFIDEERSPIEAIADAYLNKPACARHNDLAMRLEEFEQYLDIYQIDAVIFSVLKFCTDQAYWMVCVDELLKKRKIPFMFVDSDYSSSSSGQIHTRVQAFLENL